MSTWGEVTRLVGGHEAFLIQCSLKKGGRTFDEILPVEKAKDVVAKWIAQRRFSYPRFSTLIEDASHAAIHEIVNAAFVKKLDAIETRADLDAFLGHVGDFVGGSPMTIRDVVQYEWWIHGGAMEAHVTACVQAVLDGASASGLEPDAIGLVLTAMVPASERVVA